MRWIIVVALAASAFAGDEADAPKAKKKVPALQRIDPKLKLPESKRAEADKGGYGVVVNLDAEGKLAAGDKPCTLEELEKMLAAAVKEHDDFDGKESTMRVLLRLDKDAPWVHAQWILTACAKQWIGRVEIATKRADGTPGFVKAWLPIDDGVGGLKAGPAHVKLHVVARAEMAEKCGGRMVMKPTRFVYVAGGRQSEKPKDLQPALEADRRAAEKTKRDVRGELKAGGKVPLERIVLAMDLLRACKVKHIDFYGTAMPGNEVVHAARLPYPAKNYVTR